PGGAACYTFGPDALTVRRLEEVKTMPPDVAKGRTTWSVGLTLTSADASGFATLTGKAAQASQNRLPGGNMGMVVGGSLVSQPAQVMSPITGGEVEISGPPQTFSQSYVEGIVKRMTGG
ncbi:MAG: SecDF P1 head subdomain-containing protein, partial [Spirillospora sp.]